MIRDGSNMESHKHLHEDLRKIISKLSLLLLSSGAQGVWDSLKGGSIVQVFSDNESKLNKRTACSANPRLQLLLENSMSKKGHNYV